MTENASNTEKTTASTSRKVETKLSDHGVFFLNNSINNDSVGEAINFILEANLDPKVNWDHITLIINSGGGSVQDGFALIDTMFGSRIPVRTVGLGVIASMGLGIFLAGERGTRTLTPNTTVMSHQYTWGDIGKEHELIAGQKKYEIVSQQIIRHYKRTTGLSEKKIRKKLLPPEDVWLTADEAKELGICDVVKDVKPHHLKDS
jgi:ATP-dependent Clp protease protease subunit